LKLRGLFNEQEGQFSDFGSFHVDHFRRCNGANADEQNLHEQTWRLFTDGRKVTDTTPKGENVETTARWQGSQLIVVTQRANGSKLIQTYTLDQGAGHMIISTQGAGGAP